MKWLVIANPVAGRARATERLLGRLRRTGGIRHEIVQTSAPGDATRLAQQAGAFDGLVVVGGDGTIAEVLQGMDLGRQCLAVLPAGHGNCLARDLGVADAGRALASLQQASLRPLDLMDVSIGLADGREDRRLCASTLALGYVADVVALGRNRLHALGHAAYATAAMVVVPAPFWARFPGSGDARPQQYTGLVINNTAHLANFRGLPDASVHDGRLDIMEQRYGWPRQLLHNLAVLVGSRRLGPLRLRQASAEHIELEEPRALMADGEILQDVMRVSVACRPGAVSCVVGPG